MKKLITSALMLLTPALMLAQAAPTPVSKTATKPAAKAAVKPAVKVKTAKNTKSGIKAKKSRTKAKSAEKAKVAKATSSRTQLKSATSQVASGLVAAETALTPDELAVAAHVYTGHIDCELCAHVNIDPDPTSPGRFNVIGKGFKYHMSPVSTTTGTVRLEDQQGGAVWLQIANKSMLMNQKLGQRLADECMSPQQLVVAEAIKKNPPRSVLEPAPEVSN